MQYPNLKHINGTIRHHLRTSALLFVCLMMPFTQAEAQDLFGVLTPEDGAFIYHDEVTDLGQGFHVYRTHQGEEEWLTEDRPIYPAGNANEFRRAVGDLYPVIRDGLEADNPEETFFRLRGDEMGRFVLAFSYPDVARALGNLFVDEDPVTGEAVTYRFEWVNRRGEPVGKEIEETITLRETQTDRPGQVAAERDGREVTITWEYPEAGRDGDYVMRFEVYKRPEGAENFRRITKQPRLRTQGRTEFSYTYRIRAEHEAAEFAVEAVDATNRNRRSSEPVRVELIDMSPPPRITEVYSSFSDNEVQLSWPVSRDPRVAGYHVDRFIMETEEEERLTDELIDAANPVFRDTDVRGGYHYQYTITAVTEDGVESEPSNPAIENIIEVQYPEAPENLTAEYDEENARMVLSWDGEQDELFNTWVVLRRPYTRQGARAFSQVNRERHTATTILDDGPEGGHLSEGMFYEYGVTAANEQGLRSDTLFIVKQVPNITPPEPPTSFRGDLDSGGRAVLRWGASPSADVTQYQLYRVDADADTITTETRKSRRYLRDRDVSNGAVFTYFVTAIDSSGNESEPAPEIELTINDGSPPATVRNVRASAETDGVHLRWEPSLSDDEAGYIIKRSELSNGRYERLTTEPVSDTEWTDTDGERGLWYRIIAVDQTGNESRPSSPRQARGD